MDDPLIEREQNFYLLFVNTRSGDKEGKNYINLAGLSLVFMFENNKTSNVFVYDLFKDSQVKGGSEKAKSQIDKGNQVNIIICGGDGTIQWVLQIIHESKISFEKVNFGILPIGTGNDFSRTIGWGYQMTMFNLEELETLKDLVIQWNAAKRDLYDLWDVEFQTYEDGSFYRIKSEEEEKMNITMLQKSFCNYVGIGLDAKVVYSVEKNRGEKAFFNKVRYGLVGAINYFFKPMKPLNSILESFSMGQTKKFDLSYLVEKDEEQQVKEEDNIHLSNEYRGIVFLNCSSYMAGLRQVWETQKIGTDKIQKFHPQSTDDGILQVVAFKDQLRLALERIRRSGAKVTQGSGPFHIEFKRPKGQEEMFIQVDGESIKIVNLRSIRIRPSTRFDVEKLRILRNIEKQ